MARTAATHFHLLTFLTAQHWRLTRAGFAAVGFVLVLLLTGRPVLARGTAGLFWADDFKTAQHQLDWFAHYGWARRFTCRRPAFDITQGVPPAGLDALDAVLAQRVAPADLRARLYLAARRADLDGYAAIAHQIAQMIPAPTHDPAKHTPAFTRPQARSALHAVGLLMGRLNMHWYIVSGTFLGAVRAGDFLTHDYDIDIGVHAEDFDHDLFLAGVRADPQFCLVRIDDYVDLRGDALTPVRARALYKVMHRTGVEVDVFLHHLEDGQRWHGSARHRWWNVDFAVADYTLGGTPVFGPADADRYLRENYGDWRTPKTEFDCSTGTPNVSINRNLVSIAQFLTQAQAGSPTAQSVLRAEGYLHGQNFTYPWANMVGELPPSPKSRR